MANRLATVCDSLRIQNYVDRLEFTVANDNLQIIVILKDNDLLVKQIPVSTFKENDTKLDKLQKKGECSCQKSEPVSLKNSLEFLSSRGGGGVRGRGGFRGRPLIRKKRYQKIYRQKIYEKKKRQ